MASASSSLPTTASPATSSSSSGETKSSDISHTGSWTFVRLNHVSSQTNRDLLGRFYRELMIPNFPDPDELDELSMWEDMLSQPREKREKRSYLSVVLAFDRDSNFTKLQGGVAYEYHWKANCFLLTYLVVNDQARGRGVGVYLVYNAWHHMNEMAREFGYPDGVDTIFIEANNPEAMDANTPDSMDAVERLRTFQHMGVRQVQGIPFVQPSIDAHKEAVSSLLLGVIVSPKTQYHQGRAHVRASTISKWLTEYYADCEVPNFETNPDYVKQMEWLKSRDLIPLVDFKLPRKSSSSPTAATTSTTKRTVSHVADVRSKL